MSCVTDLWALRETGLAAADPEALRRWHLGRLAQTVAYVQARSRFYRDRLDGFDGRLESLPFTLPSDLVRDPQALLCVPQAAVARVTTLTTSGTTGEKKRICFTEGDLERTTAFFALGMTLLVDRGEDTLILMGADTEHSIARLLKTAVERFGVRGRIGDPAWNAEEVLAAARTADCIVGLPAELLYLCRLDGTLRPRSVLLSADFVPDSVVAALRERWGCRVFTHFGMTETGFAGAVQCGAGAGHHLRHPDLIVEIVDPVTGSPMPPGESGELVLTTLLHEAMPLLRYRTGDRASLVPEPCPCGGTLPRLGKVAGRTGNDLAPGLSIHRLDERLFALPEVLAFEARLETGGVLVLTLNMTGPVDPSLIAQALPPGIRLRMEPAPLSPFERRGKRRIQSASPMA